MNILELNFEKGWRGGERQTLYNMQGFRNAGSTVHLICRKGSAMEVQALKEGFTVFGFGSVFGVLHFLITKGKQYDFIHAQTSHILTYCVFTKFFHRSVVLFTRRVNFAQKGFFTKLKYRYTDKIIAISEAIKTTLVKFCGRNDIEVISDIVIPHPVAGETVSKAYAALNIGNRHVIGAVAALTAEKDPFTMTDAIKKLSGLRTDFVFLHFGTGNLKEAVAEKIEALQLQSTYILMGFAENLHDFIPGFEVLATTSVEEGLGSSVLDAFTAKVPVVATDAGGLKELLQEERGILCAIKDSDAIAAGINELLNNAAKKERVTSNAYQYVTANHSMQQITKKYLAVMNALMRRDKPSSTKIKN